MPGHLVGSKTIFNGTSLKPGLFYKKNVIFSVCFAFTDALFLIFVNSHAYIVDIFKVQYWLKSYVDLKLLLANC